MLAYFHFPCGYYYFMFNVIAFLKYFYFSIKLNPYFIIVGGLVVAILFVTGRRTFPQTCL